MGEDFDHGIPDNPYNKHAWILGNPEVGERVWIGAFCLIDALYASLKIGRGTDISSGAQIITHTTVRRCLSERRYSNVDSAPTEIGEFCFIGTNAVILKGCKVGHHSVIGAGAVVSENTIIPPYSLVVGVPAKVVGSSKKFLKNIEQESLSVVIPAFNEEKNVERVVEETTREIKKLKIPYEIVLVNDGSTDKTAQIIDRLAKRQNIRAVHHQKNKGFTGAIKTAFASARKHLVLLAPADGQFDFTELPKFIEAIRGYDAALGYRVKNEERWARKIKALIFHLPYLFLNRYFLGIYFKEFSTVSLWRRRVVQSIDVVSSDRSAMFLPEVISRALKARYRFAEVPIRWRARMGGKEKGTNMVVALKSLFAIMKLSREISKEKLLN